MDRVLPGMQHTNTTSYYLVFGFQTTYVFTVMVNPHNLFYCIQVWQWKDAYDL